MLEDDLQAASAARVLDGPGPTHPEDRPDGGGSAAVEAVALTRRFGAVTAVDDATRRVPRRCIFGLVGPNGTGKSTTIKVLTTVGLDPVARRSVWEHIRLLRQEFETTVLMTTHAMEEADEFCDQVAIMDRGRLAAVASPAELKAATGPAASLEDAFASNAIYPVALMPRWLQVIAALNPLTYEVDALRDLMIRGGVSLYGLGLDLALSLGMLAALVVVVANLYPQIVV